MFTPAIPRVPSPSRLGTPPSWEPVRTRPQTDIVAIGDEHMNYILKNFPDEAIPDRQQSHVKFHEELRKLAVDVNSPEVPDSTKLFCLMFRVIWRD